MRNISFHRTNRSRWVNLLTVILGISAYLGFAQRLGEIAVLNFGVPGQNSREGRERFERDVLEKHPQIVLLYFGMNDAINEKKMLSEDEYLRNMAWMVQAARTAKVFPVLSTIQHVDATRVLTRHPPSAYGPDGPNGRIDRFNTRLRGLAQQQKIELVDFQAAFDKVGGPTPERSPDGVHLNPDGYRLLAETFYKPISNRLPGVRVIVAMGDSLTFGTPLQTADKSSPNTYPAVLQKMLNEKSAPR